MTLLDDSDRRPVHFVGIAGAGMSALAELFLRRGVAISGCDSMIAGTDHLRSLGASIVQGHDAAHVDGIRAIVVTSAVSPSHPELERARELNIPVVRRAEALGEAVSGGQLVAIAGTHGKTTTTVMTTEAFAEAGLEPTGLVGGRVASWGGNLRYGSDRLFVAEADEYDRSFLALTPSVAVVTNVEADHLDIYADLADIHETFARFIGPARYVVLCADDSGAAGLPVPSSAEIVRYGTDSFDARLVARDVRATAAGGTSFDAHFDGESLGRVELRVPGMHNVRNALAALASGLVLGAPADALVRGLAAFGGVDRRFQRLGECAGVSVVDDYAHHPTEIRATLQAARAAYPGRRIIAAFQPHLFTRTRDFAGEFGRALAQADAIFLTEIYAAREQPIAGVTAALVADEASSAGLAPSWQGERTALAAALEGFVREGDVVLTIGAGDVTRTGAELLALLSQR